MTNLNGICRARMNRTSNYGPALSAALDACRRLRDDHRTNAAAVAEEIEAAIAAALEASEEPW